MFRKLFGGAEVAQERIDMRTAPPPGGISLYAGAGGLLVVGSANYANVISRGVGSIGPRGVSVTAALVPEPDNQYDRNAISVRVNGTTIGYLRREEAKAYKPVVEALASRGLTGYCRVDIRPDPDPRYIFSVQAYIDTPKRQLELIARL
jgi:hypothetical protein